MRNLSNFTNRCHIL